MIDKVKRLRLDNTNLTSQITRSQISYNEYKARYDIQLKEIKSIKAMIKILEGKLASAQKDTFSIHKYSTKKDSKIVTLKAELEHIKNKLASKIDELERLGALRPALQKSDTISKSVITGDDEENKPNNSLMKYFICKKINTNIPDHTNDEITEPPKVDSKIIPKISDDISITKINKNNILEPIVTPYLEQRENHISSLVESYPQISVGRIEAISIMASTLMSPLSVYIFLTLLIITVMWFVILRCTWGLDRKSNQLHST